MRAGLPENERERLLALRRYEILDTLPEAAYDDITHLASEICRAPISAVSLVDRDRQWFKSKVGLEVQETGRDIAFCAHAILQTDLMIVPDARADDRFADNPLVTGEPRIRFYAGAPLVTARGEVVGTLCVIDQERRTLSDGQARALRALSRQVMAQLELRLRVAEQHRYRTLLEDANSRLERESLTDDVSGFHNTRFLHRFLGRWTEGAPAPGQRLSLVFFDMDNFKRVVDAHGHLLGAAVLKEVAQAVHRVLGPQDRIVRYGGDEFVVILPEQGAAEALVKTTLMKQAIGSAAFLKEQGLKVRVTASFGLASYPDDATDMRQLLMLADRGLFRSKAKGKDCISRGTARPSLGEPDRG